MYFTATAPYALMTILLILGATLDGAVDGITYYMNPNFEKISELQVWVDAASQVFFSYSIGYGTLTALSSFNSFNHNSMRDCLIFAGINSGTSILAGFVIFSVLGFMEKQQGVLVSEVASSGPGLAFIAYPKALAQLPLSPLWSVVFFLMIILLGIDTQFVSMEGFVAAITDLNPQFFHRKWRREVFIALVCLASFFVALSMVTEGGVYVFQLFDFYFNSRNIIFIVFAECIAISYVYGMNRFEDNMEMMLGYRFKVPLFKLAWAFVTPVLLFVMFVLGCVTYTELTYDHSYPYLLWALGIGWTMSLFAFLVIPLTMVAKLATEHGTLSERFRTQCACASL